MARKLGRVRPWTLQKVVDSYTGGKKARYARALDDLQKYGYKPKFANVKAFIKFEKLVYNPDKVNPDPRMIQWRHPVYGLLLKQFTGPVEKKLYGYRVNGHRAIGKGLSTTARCQEIIRQRQKFNRPVTISLDMSRFDQHCSLEILQLEHMVYLYMCGNDRTLRRLLSAQLHNRGTTTSGIRYKTRGKRMSGDMNTALGNCLIMVMMAEATMKHLAVKNYTILDDGDDCLLTIDKSDISVLGQLPKVFLEFGFKVKLEGIAESHEEIEWCQCRPVKTKLGWRFVRNWQKLVASGLVGSKYSNERTRPKLVNTIGVAELVMNLGVPILQEYALALIRNSGTTDVLEWDSTDSLYYRIGRETHLSMKELRETQPVEVTDEARISFARAYAISPARQVLVEESLRSWRFSTGGGVYVGETIEVDGWRPTNLIFPDCATLGKSL